MQNSGKNLSIHQASLFAQKYAEATSEKQLAQSFWRDLFTKVVGISDLMAVGIEFEFPVRSAQGTINFIDVLWDGVVLVEHKSAGKNLDEAERQARDYLIALPAAQRPPTVIVSDFRRIRIVEVLAGNSYEFGLEELPENLSRLEMVVGGHAEAATREEISADQKAVELMANLFVEFEKAGYEGHEVSVFLVRILFLNFGDDTRMWKRTPRGLFGDFVAATVEDGMGVGGRLQELFQILDTPIEKRPATLSSMMKDFPYVNGGLFKEVLPVFSFTAEMRKALLLTTEYDWSKISPAIFGAMFQTVKSKEDRRNLGEHYTSEANILKVIRPLFLDEYTERLHNAWDSIPSLRRLQNELRANNYLDPACGSGNFLVVAYKRLRDLELKLVARLKELEGTTDLHAFDGRWEMAVSLDQFYGFEINEWSSQIATVAMYLADHQANREMEEVTGDSPTSFPLTKSAHIHHVNALRVDWTELCPIGESTIIMGNPPFLGSLLLSDEQRTDTTTVWKGHKRAGLMDFVTNWFILGADLVGKFGCRLGLVATNSISQGQQPAILWGELNRHGVEIAFAHRPFRWNNEAKGVAAVHVVIVGLRRELGESSRSLWTYDTVSGDPVHTRVRRINAYLIEGPDIFVEKRQTALSVELAPMYFGSMPNDGGHLSDISSDTAESIRRSDPIAAKYLRRLIGSQELINNVERFALWLVEASPTDLRASRELSSRVSAVQKLRQESKREATKKLAMRPAEFGENRQPKSAYIAVPAVSSESRRYVPMDYCPPEVIANNALLTIPNASVSVFAVLMSRPFNAWNRTVSGRLKSDMRISQEITYNNFPLRALTEEERQSLMETGQGILDARSKYPESSLADLYGPTSMPIELLKAHEANDKAVLKVFGLKADASDEAVLAKLFEAYDDMTRGILPPTPVKKARKPRKAV